MLSVDGQPTKTLSPSRARFCSSHSPAMKGTKSDSGKLSVRPGAQWTGSAGRNTLTLPLAPALPTRSRMRSMRAARSSRNAHGVFMPRHICFHSLRPTSSTTAVNSSVSSAGPPPLVPAPSTDAARMRSASERVASCGEASAGTRATSRSPSASPATPPSGRSPARRLARVTMTASALALASSARGVPPPPSILSTCSSIIRVSPPLTPWHCQRTSTPSSCARRDATARGNAGPSADEQPTPVTSESPRNMRL
mmetsp:Transcript_6700/g.27328  ORF Transcript_6700/g.27328 Transcript_6700/m.27328 type:complete len:253 (-) Transcript_6700:52-810(-)